MMKILSRPISLIHSFGWPQWSVEGTGVEAKDVVGLIETCRQQTRLRSTVSIFNQQSFEDIISNTTRHRLFGDIAKFSTWFSFFILMSSAGASIFSKWTSISQTGDSKLPVYISGTLAGSAIAFTLGTLAWRHFRNVDATGELEKYLSNGLKKSEKERLAFFYSKMREFEITLFVKGNAGSLRKLPERLIHAERSFLILSENMNDRQGICMTGFPVDGEVFILKKDAARLLRSMNKAFPKRKPKPAHPKPRSERYDNFSKNIRYRPLVEATLTRRGYLKKAVVIMKEDAGTPSREWWLAVCEYILENWDAWQAFLAGEVSERTKSLREGLPHIEAMHFKSTDNKVDDFNDLVTFKHRYFSNWLDGLNIHPDIVPKGFMDKLTSKAETSKN